MTYKEHMKLAGRMYVEETLHAAGNSPREAAKLAGISRQDFYRLIARYGVEYVPAPKKGGGNAAWRTLSVAG